MLFPIFWRVRRADRVAGQKTRFLIESLEERTLLSVFTVTNTNNSGAGSLRDAITQANSTSGLDSITFNIPGTGVQKIAPTFFLPQITDPVEIHGESQPGYAGKPLIELDGTNAGNSNGLEIKVGGNLVQGLDIHNFLLDGIVFAEPSPTGAVGNNKVLNNFLGTDSTGMIAGPNTNGIHFVYSPNNFVKGNLLSGNAQSGIFIGDKFSTGTHIEGNLIGTNITGLAALPNGLNGVALGAPENPTASDGFGSGTFVGGSAVAQRNVISGNAQSGVWIEGGDSNTVQGNYIGVGVDGTTAVANGTKGTTAVARFGIDGVFIKSGTNNSIGGVGGAANIISGNTEDGVQINLTSSGNQVLGNFIGIAANGTTALPNARDGVSIFDSASNTIGGTAAGAGNIISGNKSDGIFIGDGTIGGTSANLVQGNIIGLDVTGFTPIPNQSNGVAINTATANTIGGTVAAARNVISGNKTSGVVIGGSNTTGNQVQGNFIGTDATGLLARPNQLDGVDIFDAPLNVIGGTTAGARNIISGNASDGVLISDTNAAGNIVEGNYIGTDVTGSLALANASNGIFITAIGTTGPASNNTVGGNVAGARNLISGNGNDGVQISLGVTGTNVLGNLIGTTAAGTAALPNARHGVSIFDASGNTIGAPIPSSGYDPLNIISGNAGIGVLISGVATGTATTNKIIGNFIGTDITGTKAVGNTQDGVLIENAATNSVGGITSNLRNIISGNDVGIVISGTGAKTNSIYANFIGTDVSGTVAVPNNSAGIYLNDVPSNFIGNGTPATLNVISGNKGTGVYIRGANAKGNALQGNYIGTNALGLVALPNVGDGVVIDGATDNTIGGIETGESNVISGNTSDGIDIFGATAKTNRIQHNFIGVDLSSVIHIGNQRYGIEIHALANNNSIGGPDPLYANTIAYNGTTLGAKGYGVEVDAGTGNSIRENLIYNNTGRGIDLVNLAAPDTFTVNDFQDATHPADLVQDTPVVTSVTSDFFTTVTTWSFNSTPSTTFALDLFSNSKPNASGFGDGERFISTANVTTDVNGNATFKTVTAVTDLYLSVTVTGPSNNTSEFSMVDTDADGLADTWETRGLDMDEDGTIDYTLPGANPLHKDVYVEVDAMTGFQPQPTVLPDTIAAFAASTVMNPDGTTGITLHAALDEVMPVQDWTTDLNGNGTDGIGEDRNGNGILDPGEDVNGNGVLDPGDPTEQNGWAFFNLAKTNGINGVGGFGTASERANLNEMDAKRLTYRYCIFADFFATPFHTGTGTELSTSGIAEIGGNDFMVTLGKWGAVSADQQAGTFMHELGHTLGLHHGGADDVNIKPNYHSVMNYLWQTPNDWMYEDTNQNGIRDWNDLNHNGVKDLLEPYTEFDINGNGVFGDKIWKLNYSSVAYPDLNELSLNESDGIGGVAGNWVPFGAHRKNALESGPVDWSESDADHDGNASDDIILTGIDLNIDGSKSVLKGYDDWSNIQYDFRDGAGFATGAAEVGDPDEMTLEDYWQQNAIGVTPGVMEFAFPTYTVSEADGAAVITVTRAGGTIGPVTVNYSTSDDTARDGQDYTGVSGTLSFADGEYIKTFSIPIIDDFIGEQTESVLLTLNQTTNGAMLSSKSTATLNITDNDTSSVFTVTNTNDTGLGSLRNAILLANATFGRDIITFNIGTGVHTIIPLSPLPTITDGVEIDGTTQPGYAGKPIIEISGQSAPGEGLMIKASNTTIRGLVINNFSDAGILAASALGGSVNTANPPQVANIVIENNYLGTDATGLISKPNRIGIFLGGIGGTQFHVGGTLASERNVISGNSQYGIQTSAGKIFRIEGNYIGLAADGTSPLGNGITGILIGTGGYLGFNSTDVVIGGLQPGAGNIIAYNANFGVENDVVGQHLAAQDGHAILSNSIHDNGLLGINLLSGNVVNLNDSGLQDGTSSNPQNYPIFGSAISTGGQTTISGYLNSRPNESFTVQFFSNTKLELSGFGEGETYLGSTTVTTDANGHVDFAATFNVTVPNHRYISGTATDSRNETSEFSPRLTVGDVLGNVYIVNTTDDVDDGIADATHTSLREAILAANNHPGPDTIRFAIGTGVQTIAPLTPLPVITDAVTIDGTTQPGFAGTPIIQLIGTSMERNRFNSASSSNAYLTGIDLQTNNSTVRGLVINRFYEFGGSDSSIWGGIPVTILGNGNVLAGNFIGTDVAGAIGMANLEGVGVSGNNNRIGGTTAADRNVISGNFENGLSVNGTGNLIEGNFIGTDATGTKALANGRGSSFNSVGVTITGSNMLGGTAPGAGNVISGNLGNGVNFNDAAGSIVQGNIIGLDVTGTKVLGNPSGDGIWITENSFRQPGIGVTIGGTQAGARNLISGNRVGIFIISGFGDVIQGNYIGTDVTGMIDFGNGIDGIIVRGESHQIGGTAAGAGNLISGNNRFGILLAVLSGPTDKNQIQGNRIGTTADGTGALGNSVDGIAVAPDFNASTTGTGPTDNLIGGTDAGAGNIIAFNGQRGVDILAGDHIGILSNSIFSNGVLGIDLNGDGVTPNDTNDADAGDNDLQNYPVLATAVTDGSHTTITGSFNSTPNGIFIVQFFASAAAGASGFGQGKTLIGTRQVTTDSAGNATFTFNLDGVASGQFIAATATDALNNTSEFSAAIAATVGTTVGNQPPFASAGGPYIINEGDSLALDGSFTFDPDGDPLTYTWDVNGDGVFGDAIGVKPTLTWAQLQALGIVDGPSTFSPKVRVDDGQGHIVTSAATTLTLKNVTPVPTINGNTNVFEGQQVSLTGTFIDPGTADTHTYHWHVDADNGQVIADGTSANFSFLPVDNGTYTVTFDVIDSNGAKGTATVDVNVNNADPIVVVDGVPDTGTVGVTVNLTTTVTDVPVDTAAGFIYQWYARSLDDEEFEFSATTPNFSFAPTVAGTYQVILQVSDKDGGQSFQQFLFDVSGPDTGAPVVRVDGDAIINEGSGFVSNGSFTDPDATDTWAATVNYGDGTGDQPLTLKPNNGFDLGHIYKDNGNFDVVVTVTDSSGLSGTATAHVKVLNVSPVIDLPNTLPSSTAGSPFTLAGSFTDPGADTWTATVDYGDGSGIHPLSLAANKTFALAHTYQNAGNFDVTVTVTDDDGGVDTITRSESVQNAQSGVTVAAAGGTYGTTTTLSATLVVGGTPLSGKTLTFKLNGNIVGTAITNASGVASLSALSILGLSAGDVAISVSFAGDGQNASATGTGTLTIAKAALTITAANFSRVYGQSNPTLTGTVDGVVTGDGITATFATIASATSAVGPYAITPTLVDPNGKLSNYAVTVVNGVLTVLKTTLTAHGFSVSSPEGSLFNGVVASFTTDNPIATASNFAATITWGNGQTTNGTVQVATGGGFEVVGSTTYADNGTFPISISITDNAGLGTASPSTSAIVGNVAPTVTLATPTAVDAGSAFSLGGSFIDPGADTWTATVNYGDGTGDQSLALAANHTFALNHIYATGGSFNVVVKVTDDDGGTGTANATELVNSKAATTLAASATAATYGGSTTLSVTLTAAGNPLANKTLTFLLNGSPAGSAVTNASGVATLSNVALGTLAAGQANVSVSFAGDTQNLASTGGATLIIAKASLLITAGNASRVYGQNNPSLTGSVATLLNGDAITVTFVTAAVPTSPVNTYAITASILDPNNRLANYNVTVIPGTLTVQVTTLTATGKHVAANEGSAINTVVASFTSNNPIASAADFSAIITWGNGTTSNGTIQAASGGGFEVVGVNTYADNGLFPISIAIHDNAGLGSASPTTQATIANVGPTVLLGTPTTVGIGVPFTLAGSFTDPGADTWTATVDYGDGSGAQPLTLAADKTFALNHIYSAGGNFKVTVSVTDKDNGVGTGSVFESVSSGQTSIAASAATGTYGGSTTLSATLTTGATVLAGKTLVFALNGATVGSAVTNSAGVATLSNLSIKGLSAGPVSISVSFAADGQNSAAVGTATLTIAKAKLTVSADNKSRVFGQNNPTFTGLLTGVVAGDAITAAFTTTATKTSAVGSYAITATLVDPANKLANYDVTITPGSLAVLATTLVATGKTVTGSEGSTFTGVVASFTSNNPIAAAADFTATINWGNGRTSAGAVRAALGGGFEVVGDNTYADNGTFPLSIAITDTAGQGTANPTGQAQIANVAPTPTIAGAPATAPLGTTLSLIGSATDPSSVDTAAGFTFKWVVTKKKNNVTTTVGTGTGSTLSLKLTDTAVYTVTLTATDKDGGIGTTSRTITVAPVNAAPVVTLISPGVGDAYSTGCPVNFSGCFTDPDSPGAHTAVFTLTSPGLPTITIPGTIGYGNRVSARYTFRTAGIYSVTLSVTDAEGATGRDNTVCDGAAELVIFDPSAGRITGSGSFNTTSGKASFSFNAQYRCDTDPTGDFQFTVGKLNFRSSDFDWLVVTGNKAELRGSGTVNGHRYAFLLTIIDGKKTGAADRIRIKIWDPYTTSVLFDSLPGAGDTDDPTATLLTGDLSILK